MTSIEKSDNSIQGLASFISINHRMHLIDPVYPNLRQDESTLGPVTARLLNDHLEVAAYAAARNILSSAFIVLISF